MNPNRLRLPARQIPNWGGNASHARTVGFIVRPIDEDARTELIGSACARAVF